MNSSPKISGVGRIVVRRARLVATVPLLLALAAWLSSPFPSLLDDGWWQSLPDRFPALPPDVLLAGALLVGAVTAAASIGFRRKGVVRLLALLLLGSTVVAVARAVGEGLCATGDCLDSISALGWVAIAWLVAVLVAIGAWVATLGFDGARRAT